MRVRRSICLVALAVAAAGCGKRSRVESVPAADVSPQPVPTDSQASARREWGSAHFDVCGLITKQEVEATQHTPITETKSVGGSDGPLLISQCFYLAGPSTLAVGLAVAKAGPSPSSGDPVKEYWNRMFSPDEVEQEGRPQQGGERSRATEPEEKERTPPRPVKDIGEAAYWYVGTLSVLKNDTMLRVSVGGTADEEARLAVAKQLAATAVAHL